MVEDDKLPGWHGAPSEAESLVPMVFSFPGQMRGVIVDAIAAASKGDTKLRSRHLKSTLEFILQKTGNQGP